MISLLNLEFVKLGFYVELMASSQARVWKIKNLQIKMVLFYVLPVTNTLAYYSRFFLTLWRYCNIQYASGTTTLSIMTFSIMTLSIMTFSMTTLSIRRFIITILSALRHSA
jgi:hypothetical protein